MKDEKSLYILLTTLSIAVIVLAVGYATLSTEIKVTTTAVNVTPQTWKVAFENGTVEPTKTSTSDTGFACSNATVTDTTVTLNATLSKPGDKCTYALNVVNSGSISALLSNIVPKTPDTTSCEVSSGSTIICGKITYLLTKSATDETALLNVADKDVINTGSNNKLPIYLIVKYNSEELATEATSQQNAGFTLTFVQD